MLTIDSTTRNLLYHIYPVINHQRWEWNVEQLCKRLHWFNGKIIVAIASDPPEGRKPDPKPIDTNPPDAGRIIRGCDTADKVKAEFTKRWSGKPIEFMEFENDPELREVKTLIPMLSGIMTDDPHSITFYAHAKGVTRAPGHGAHRFTENLYGLMLDVPRVIKQLNACPVTGCYKRLGRWWEKSESDWHYNGSWFWFRTAELAKRDWRKIDPYWWGIEPYPSLHFREHEAGCLTSGTKDDGRL